MTQNAQTVQMNMRINKELKEAGDAALADIGLTPSSAVRALWSRAALRGESLASVQAVLCLDASPPLPDIRLQALQQGWSLSEQAARILGMPIEGSSGSSEEEDAELLADAWYERFETRGLG